MGCNASTQVSCETINTIPYSIVLLGLPNVGKTTLVEFLSGEYNRNNPPIHTNGVIIREFGIRNVKYRFFDLSGYFSHYQDWEDTVKKFAEGVVFVCDKSGAEEGIFFTREILERIGPLICSKKVPVFILVTKASQNQNMDDLMKVVNEFIPDNIKKGYGYIPEFNDEVFQVFEWFEKVLVSSKKKK